MPLDNHYDMKHNPFALTNYNIGATMNMKSMIGCVFAMLMGMSFVASADEASPKEGFIEGSKINILERNMYMNRDYRKGGYNESSKAADKNPKGYGEEWGNGIIATWESGFTQGTVGFGLDAFVMNVIKLDSGGGRGGIGVLPMGDSGKPDDGFTKMGGAVKLKFSETVFKYGNMMVETPVFDTGDSRLIPETATGFFITSNEIKDLELNAGHFTALNSQTTSRRDSVYINGETLKSIDFLGGKYSFTPDLSASLYASHVKDFWNKKYANVNYIYALNDSQSLDFDFNFYHTDNSGKSYAGEVDSNIWSLAAGYTFGAHKITLIRQSSTGKGEGDPYGVDGGDTIYLGNSVQYSDFNHQGEKSWQVRYDIDMVAYGVPGLSFMARYVTSNGIDIYDNDDKVNSNGKAYERNLEAKYVVQSGYAKNLSVRVRQANYRSHDLNDNVDEVRLIVSYPLSIM